MARHCRTNAMLVQCYCQNRLNRGFLEAYPHSYLKTGI